MARTGILTGTINGKPEVIFLQDTPLDVQVRKFDAIASGEDTGKPFVLVELFTSAGGVKRKDVKAPAPVAAKKATRKAGK